MKKIITLGILIIALLLSSTCVYASTPAQDFAADVLYNYGLFSGTGTNERGLPVYSLDKVPSRTEAITLLVRLLGKSNEACSNYNYMPFTDVPSWAYSYVSYAYANGLTSGTSAKTFGSDDPVTPSQYITFVLRALGYSTGEDFRWDAAWELSDKLGVTNGEYNENTTSFTRGDVVTISTRALSATLKESSTSLLDKLKADGAVNKDAKQYSGTATAIKPISCTLADWTAAEYKAVDVDFSTYVSSATVTKFGDGYKFTFVYTKPDQFEKYQHTPGGLVPWAPGYDDFLEKYGEMTNKIKTGGGDKLEFYLPYDFIFENGVGENQVGQKELIMSFFIGSGYDQVVSIDIMTNTLPQ